MPSTSSAAWTAPISTAGSQPAQGEPAAGRAARRRLRRERATHQVGHERAEPQREREHRGEQRVAPSCCGLTLSTEAATGSRRRPRAASSGGVGIGSAPVAGRWRACRNPTPAGRCRRRAAGRAVGQPGGPGAAPVRAPSASRRGSVGEAAREPAASRPVPESSLRAPAALPGRCRRSAGASPSASLSRAAGELAGPGGELVGVAAAAHPPPGSCRRTAAGWSAATAGFGGAGLRPALHELGVGPDPVGDLVGAVGEAVGSGGATGRYAGSSRPSPSGEPAGAVVQPRRAGRQPAGCPPPAGRRRRRACRVPRRASRRRRRAGGRRRDLGGAVGELPGPVGGLAEPGLELAGLFARRPGGRSG